MSVPPAPIPAPSPVPATTQKIFVTGATGYVGRHVVRQLALRGFAVRALTRPASGEMPASDSSTIAAKAREFHSGSVTDAASLKGACDGCDAVIHLVGIINETEDTMEHVHVEGTRNVVAEAKRAGVKRFIYLSGLGARAGAVAKYHQTKYAAEQIVTASGMEAYNFQASTIFGPEDEFLNLFVKFAQNIFNPAYPPWPIMPAIGGGNSFLQPIWVEDVAAILTRACEVDFAQRTPPGVYQIGGPEPLTFKQIMNIACRVAGRKRIFVPIPIFAAKIIATLLEKFTSKPLLTNDQVIMLQEDGRAKNNKSAEILGREPRTMWDYAQEQFKIPATT